MISAADLQFDKMDVDTKLAQKYLKKNNNEFHCIGGVETGAHMYDAANNKIYCSDPKLLLPSEKTRSKDFLPFIKLAKKIQDNMKLFCELEFLIRGKAIQTTQIELIMIIRHLYYLAKIHTKHFFLQEPLLMRNDSPLIELGCVDFIAETYHLLAAENTAVVCHLFTELCRSSGFDSFKLSFLKNEDIQFDGISKTKVLDGGCIGVVTAQSDIESAVGVFLSALKGDLWGIRRILVQESACERFKTEFAWRTRSGSQADVDPQLKTLSTDVYVYDGTIYLREYVGNDTSLRNVVLIEAFRTVKELLTLIEGYQPFSVSLWSHGAAESNEIAFGITAPMVWVNGYGIVGAPYQVSMAYYCQRIPSACESKPEVEKVRKLQKDWIKLPMAERRKTLLNVIQKVPYDDNAKYYMQGIFVVENRSRNFVHIGNGDLVIGESKPRDVYAVHWESVSENVVGIIYRLYNGSGFLINVPAGVNNPFKNILALLAEAGLPIQFGDFPFPPDSSPLPDTTRVVHSSFGTIFAN